MRRANTVVLAALVAANLQSGPAAAGLAASSSAGRSQAAASEAERAGCAALLHLRNLTVTYAGLAETSGGTSYCYVKGILPPAIHFHVQMPLPRDWNGRFLKWGDGGKDGDLDFADHRVAEGYAVANSNTGHDNGAEPGSSFAYDNRQAEIDFGYRAVHLTVAAAKTLVGSYYGREPAFSYFEGCSTGGRQGLMEAQRYPTDFDGIVAGAPANHYQEMNAVRVWLLQRMFRDDFAGALATDTDGDGRFDSVRKLDLLADAVVAACDRDDGVADGVIDDPLACGFDPDRDLAAHGCPAGTDGESCFTAAQIRTIRDFHAGPRDRHGEPIYAGKPFGSERQWAGLFIPYTGNGFAPGAVRLGGDHLNYLFYDVDPGVPPADMLDTSAAPDRTATPPEWAWWNFDIDDVTDGKGDVMRGITDAVDPDLTRFLLQQDGKLILYHGWADALVVPQPTVTYYRDMVDATFGGDVAAARERARLFMAPGMNHCRGGVGPDTWDRLRPLVDWVERGAAPDALIATHATDGVVDNERPICAYPERAVYTGPAGGADDPANWVAENFTCR
ncbi:MAG: tannase/feruloyl esterase family alpha/beta hydrolase [Acidobacteria bacterium]|nr:tannase/feruloyl esterase family alpha/beta hydrolase [Acidobacteriota bacterium]